MMRGYLDNPKNNDPSSVTITNLPAAFTTNGYDVYVYADESNGTSQRTGAYAIGSARGTITDNSSTNFNGTFTQAINSAGNYAKVRESEGVVVHADRRARGVHRREPPGACEWHPDRRSSGLSTEVSLKLLSACGIRLT